MNEIASELERARELINQEYKSELIKLYAIRSKLIGYAVRLSRNMVSDEKKRQSIDFEDLISEVIINAVFDGKTSKKDINHQIYVYIGKEASRLNHLRGLDAVGKRLIRAAIRDRQCYTCKEILPYAYFPYYAEKDKSLFTSRGRCVYCIRKYEDNRRSENEEIRKLQCKRYYEENSTVLKERARLRKLLKRKQSADKGLTPKGKKIIYMNHPGEFKVLYDHYKVYKDGTIIRMPTGSYLSEALVPQEKTARKGMRIKILAGYRYYVHDLVAKCWHTEWYEGCQVIHQDGDKTNNRVSNLEIVSKKHEAEPPDQIKLTYRRLGVSCVVDLTPGPDRID